MRSKRLSKKDISLNRLANFKKEVVTNNHQLPIDELCDMLGTDIKDGLTKEQVRIIFSRTGPNALTPPRTTPEYIKFLKTISQGFSLLLWIGAALCFLGVFIEYTASEVNEFEYDNVILGCTLIVIILLTGIFMYCQEHKSSSIMNSFANMIPQHATVIRDGKLQVINVRELVVGDLVDVKGGDKIPADIRITKSQGFKVDNSCLTGENEPLLRTNQCTNSNILETKNMAFFSTSAVEGNAQGLVVSCGDHTVIGRIAGLTARLIPVATPMRKELRRFIKLISIWACFLGLVFGGAALIMRYPFINTALFVIGIIVANVPEGLLATVTVSLTVTAKKMAAKNCLVKNLEAVETLGSTSVICSDKTGTLTQNRMTVCHLWYNAQVHNADLSADQFDARRYRENDDFKVLLRCATLCNRASFEMGEDVKAIAQRSVLGDASEAAILKFTELSHKAAEDFRRSRPKLCEIPFNSSSKYQVSVHAEKDYCLLVMKGAPERILEKCTTIKLSGMTLDLSDIMRKQCEKAVMELAARGERVLGFADLIMTNAYPHTYPFTIDPVPNFPMEKLRFVGYISLIDPPRPQVPDAVAKCRAAGVQVIMVTGDHPITAKAIAKDVGIISGDAIDAESIDVLGPPELDKAIVVSGSVLREYTIEQLDSVLLNYREIVFARTSPTQKLQIVEGVQRQKRIVAVTGDGVNDSPALKQADIGIAMGISGSEVSQHSADMILLDDNFASIVIAIEEGRKIFDNLKKSIAYTLTSNIPEVTPYLMFIVLSIPLPVGILAILCIDVLTDMLPAISLAYEKSESDIMSRPPRRANRDHLVSFKLYLFAYGHIGMIESAAGFFVYFIIMAEYGFMPKDLIGLRAEWDDHNINDLRDSFKQEWTYLERKVLEHVCSTAFMIAVVVCQWGCVIACKTRINSIAQQGMTNWILNLSIFVETVVVCFLSYGPYMNYLKFYPVKIQWWLIAIPFSVIILVFDELRKWHIRRFPNGWYYRETYY